MRKLFAEHVFTVRRPNFDRFYDEHQKIRTDFDKIYKSKDALEVQVMLEKYETYVERQFEPYAAMHASRPHSNLWGKDLVFNDAALQTDHVGYYKELPINGIPTEVHFHE